MVIGVICEYNPLHLGHQKQLDIIRSAYGDDCYIVCLMSGNYVQRGTPAIFDKSVRAHAAIQCGADLVLELPVTAALSSAEGFASQGVAILSHFCNALCFGAETADKAGLMATAEALLSPEFSSALHVQLDVGLSFPAARQAALAAIGMDGEILTLPNNILAIEYCKAILRQKSPMEPMPIQRLGSYHADTPDPENPSATFLRQLMADGSSYAAFVPEAAAACYRGAAMHTLEAGERAILSRLRTMSDEEFEHLPYGSEGLWRKLMHASRKEATLEAVLTATKSKRYTRTRLDRMVMCAFLGLAEDDLQKPAPYVRVLGLNRKGRELLKTARKSGHFPNAGECQQHPYQSLENRCGDLYGLFATEILDPPGMEALRRVFYQD